MPCLQILFLFVFIYLFIGRKNNTRAQQARGLTRYTFPLGARVPPLNFSPPVSPVETVRKPAAQGLTQTSIGPWLCHLCTPQKKTKNNNNNNNNNNKHNKIAPQFYQIGCCVSKLGSGVSRLFKNGRALDGCVCICVCLSVCVCVCVCTMRGLL